MRAGGRTGGTDIADQLTLRNIASRGYRDRKQMQVHTGISAAVGNGDVVSVPLVKGGDGNRAGGSAAAGVTEVAILSESV